jgi:hypothetical protein
MIPTGMVNMKLSTGLMRTAISMIETASNFIVEWNILSGDILSREYVLASYRERGAIKC